MASAFQSGAFQVAAFQLDGVVPPVVEPVPEGLGGGGHSRPKTRAGIYRFKSGETWEENERERQREREEARKKASSPPKLTYPLTEIVGDEWLKYEAEQSELELMLLLAAA